MPEEKIRRRGGAVRYRTIKPKKGRYIHVAVTRKPGPRGGRTVAGPVHKTKAAKRKARKR